MVISPEYQLRPAASAPERPQFPGFCTAISGLRYYNPSSGRWINRDSTGEAGGINLYEAFSNDSICSIDSIGREGITPGGVAIDLAFALAKGAISGAVLNFVGHGIQGNYLSAAVIDNAMNAHNSRGVSEFDSAPLWSGMDDATLTSVVVDALKDVGGNTAATFVSNKTNIPKPIVSSGINKFSESMDGGGSSDGSATQVWHIFPKCHNDNGVKTVTVFVNIETKITISGSTRSDYELDKFAQNYDNKKLASGGLKICDFCK